MDDLMVNVKIPRYFIYDLFGGSIKCFAFDLNPMDCSLCRFNGSERCVNVKFEKSKLCVEEEEVTTAVAGVGKSSERDSETASSGESRAKPCVKPLKKIEI